jgi:hypothetical protein
MRGRVQGWESRPLGSRSFLLSTIIIIYRDRRAITLIISIVREKGTEVRWAATSNGGAQTPLPLVRFYL